jgi:hypothetical protein
MIRSIATMFVTVTLLGGCVVRRADDPDRRPPPPPVLDPFGNDFAMEGEWTVNGGAPTAASCGSIASVRVILWDAGTSFSYDELTFACSQGSFATRAIFTYGAYDTQWQALDAGGRVLGEGPREALDVVAPATTVTLGTVDFTAPVEWDPFGSDFAMEGAWTIDGYVPTAETCGVIADVRVILWHEGTFHDYADLTFPCAAGSFSTDPIFVYGAYETQWQALDVVGNVLGEGARESLVVNAPTNLVTLRPVDFAGTATGAPLSVNLLWLDGFGDAYTCDIGVAEMSYQLIDGAGFLVDEAYDLACGIRIEWSELEYGVYSLYVEGRSFSGTKDWMVRCEGLSVGTSVEYDCPVTYLP